MNKLIKQTKDSALIRFNQDEIIDKFLTFWAAAKLTDRKQLPYKVVKNGRHPSIETPDGVVVVRCEFVEEGLVRVVWVRSLEDLKQLRDIAGVVNEQDTT